MQCPWQDICNETCIQGGRGLGYRALPVSATFAAVEEVAMQLREVMTPRPEYVSPETPIGEVATMMKAKNIGILLVADHDRLIGAVTDRDIVVRGIAEGWDPRTAKTEDIMTSRALYCFDDQDIREAARLMEEKHVRRLAVLNRHKKLVGIVSLGDLALKSDDETIPAQVMRSVATRRD